MSITRLQQARQMYEELMVKLVERIAFRRGGGTDGQHR